MPDTDLGDNKEPVRIPPTSDNQEHVSWVQVVSDNQEHVSWVHALGDNEQVYRTHMLSDNKEHVYSPSGMLALCSVLFWRVDWNQELKNPSPGPLHE